MSFARQRTEIEGYFFPAFALVNPTVPVTGENADFNPPEQAPWLRISFQVADQFETCLGESNNAYRTEGIITVQVFTPLSEGASEAGVLIDDVLLIFRNASTSDMDRITILRSAISFSGQEEGWYQLNAAIDYRAED